MRHQIIRIRFLGLLCALAVWLTAAKALATGEPWSGSGTEDAPWEISSAADLQMLAERVNSGDACYGSFFVLTRDVDLSDVCGGEAGVSWDPIGHFGDVTFYGTFDGGGNSVTGLYISGGESYRGLFGTVSGTVKNLTVSGSVLGGDTAEFIGGVAGMSYGTLSNCAFSGTVSGRSYIGGVVGAVGPDCVVSDCASDAAVSGTGSAIGGVVGWANNISTQESRGDALSTLVDAGGTGLISNCTFSGTVTDRSPDNVTTSYDPSTGKLTITFVSNAYGGVVGWANGYRLTGCVNNGTVTCIDGDASGGGDFIGGVVGDASNGCVLTGCVNNGAVVGKILTGGVAGRLHDSRAVDCSNAGTVSGVQITGGVAGVADKGSAVASSHNTAEGSVTGSGPEPTYTGGVLGLTNCDPVGCDNAGTVIGNDYVGGVAAWSTSSIHSCSNLAGSLVGSSAPGAAHGHIGGVVGHIAANGNISDCTNYGTVAAQADFAGGVAGYVTGSAADCENHGQVSGVSFVGGVAGHVNYSVTNCVNYGAVSGASRVGGVVGQACAILEDGGDTAYVTAGTVSGCVNRGAVTATGVGEVGGVIGRAFNDVTGCRNEESVTVHITYTEGDHDTRVGGVVGYARRSVSGCSNIAAVTASSSTGQNAKITGGVAGTVEGALTECSNSGGVTGERMTGGVAGGIKGTALSCVNTASVTGGDTVGGVVGAVDEGAALTQCENSGAVSGTIHIGGVVGATEGEVSDCVNRSSVEGSSTVGGVVGYCTQSGTVTGCTNAAGAQVSAQADDDEGTGGVVGYSNGTTAKCTSLGSVNGRRYTGGVVGFIGTTGAAWNCNNGGTVVGSDYTGGVAGYVNDGVSLSYSTNAGPVTGDYGTGGVAGECDIGAQLSHCSNAAGGAVQGRLNTGGVVGVVNGEENNPATVEACENNGPVTGTGTETGGVAGVSAYGTVTNCVNRGTVNGRDSVGGVIGANQGRCEDCTNAGAVHGTYDYVGGIAGSSSATVKRCVNAASVKGDKTSTGGIVGYNTGEIDACENAQSASVDGYGTNKGGVAGFVSGKVTNCANRGEVKGNRDGSDFATMGGIVGYCRGDANTAALISGCTNYRALSGPGARVGGIVGMCGDYCTVTDCQNKGEITASYTLTGGVVGSITGTTATVTRCKNTAKVNGGGQDCIGGVAGYSHGTVSASSNTAAVTGRNYTGGIVGALEGGTVSNCVNEQNAAVSGNDYVGGICGIIEKNSDRSCSVGNCSNAATVTGKWCVGGIAGACGLNKNDGSTLTNCSNAGAVSARSVVGGIVGIQDSTVISLCTNTAVVTATDTIAGDGKVESAGGIAGESWYASISECKNTNTVSAAASNGQSQYAGGIAGYSSSNLTKNVNSGAVSCGKINNESFAGGIAGAQAGARIEQCTNYGEVTGEDRCVGGIAGSSSGYIGCCQNSGMVAGGTNTGGIAGQVESATIEKSRNTAEVNGYANVGGIAGITAGTTTLRQCACPYTSVYVHAKDGKSGNKRVGGLVGNFGGGTLEDCYSRATVSGYGSVGGLLGETGSATLTRCFCFPNGGGVYKNALGDGLGTLVAAKGSDATVTYANCYYYSITNPIPLGYYGLSGAHNKDDYKAFAATSSFLNQDWYKGYNFNSVWKMGSESAILAFEEGKGSPIYTNPPAPVGPANVPSSPGAPTSGPSAPGTSGTPEARTLSINTVDELKALRDSVNNGDSYLNATILLSADLDLAGADWTPIGVFVASAANDAGNRPFNGTFEGQGHRITGLNVSKTDAGAAGLFGFIGAGGTVRELSVSGSVSLTVSDGMALAGGVAGVNAGVVERCAFVGNVSGSAGSFAGGAADYTENSTGGVVGLNRGSVRNCLHVGSVSGGSRAGGVVGGSGGSTEYCLHVGGTVAGQNVPGGAVGCAYSGLVVRCHAAAESAADAVGAILTAAAVNETSLLDADALKTQGSYASLSFDAVWGMGADYPVLRSLGEPVTLEPNGGAGEAQTLWLLRGGALRAVNPFTRSGCVFIGWNTRDDGKGAGFADWAGISHGTTLYAQWKQGNAYGALYTPLTVTVGCEGSGAEDYRKLLDGNDGTEWHVTDVNGEFSMEFSTEYYLSPCAYGMTTGSESADNPLSWTLEAKAQPEDGWLLLDEAADGGLPPADRVTVYRPLTVTDEYCYYRLTVRGVGSGNEFRLSEFRLVIKEPGRSAKITYDPQGGTGEALTAYCPVGIDTVLPDNPYTRTGYVFAGWNTRADGNGTLYAAGDPYPVTGDGTLYAVWTKSSFTVRFLTENGDGTLATETVEAGQVPLYRGQAPTKAATATENFQFMGWTPAVKAITADTVYCATFVPYDRIYTVTWKNGDATLEHDAANTYDTPAEYNGATPVKADDTEHTYTFSGWSDGTSFYAVGTALPNVKADTVFTAQFTAAPRKYNITWEDWDGTLFRIDQVAYGETPVYGEAPTRAPDVRYAYAFSGWSPSTAPVTGEAVYAAQYTPTLRSYAVTWASSDGQVLRTDDAVEYGTVPDYGAIPERPATVSTEYTFSHWYPAIRAVDGDVTYTAQFGDATRSYAVRWMNGGELLEEDTVPYATMPVYSGQTPTRPDEGYYTYTFAGWTPDVVPVGGETTYSAVFDAATVSFDVRFRSNGGLGVTESETVLRGLNCVLPDSSFTPPVKTVFDAWEIDGERYAPGDAYAVGCDTDVYALWKPLYTVTWANDDGTVLRIDEVPAGETPAYGGALPTRQGDGEKYYFFTGWSPAITAAAGDVTYTAQFGSEYLPLAYLQEFPSELSAPAGGRIRIQPVSADPGQTVTLTAEPEEGWQLAKLTVRLRDGTKKTVQLTEKGDGVCLFTMPGAQVEIEALFEPADLLGMFPDLDPNGWYLDAVRWALSHGVMRGTDRGFEPNIPTTRAMVAQILFNLSGDKPGPLTDAFDDVRADDWYAAAVSWAVQNGVAQGKGASFDPDGPITREEVAVMLWNFAKHMGYDVSAAGSLAQFTDAESVSLWAEDAMGWAVGAGLINGMGDGTVNPQGNTTRAQIAALIQRFCEKVMK